MIEKKKKLLKSNFLFLFYAPKNFNNAYTKYAGQTIAFNIPKTPIQNPVAVEMK